MLPFVGLTGGIGAGKSTALDALQRLGAATLSTDRVVHELYADPAVRDEVVARFGSAVQSDGVIDRAALAREAFATPQDHQWLESLLWPRVGERMVAWRETLESAQPRPRAAVIEVPLLFESGLDHDFDATIAVIADEATREARASARGHEALAERGARQLSQEEKSQHATYTVRNDATTADLEAKLSAILDMLRR